MLVSLTQIDYDNDMALVAFERKGNAEKILGVARFMSKPGEAEPGFAVTVRDSWQRKRIGETLMKQILIIAKERGILSLWGEVLAENVNMLSIVKELGGEMKRSADIDGYEVRINLSSLDSLANDDSLWRKILTKHFRSDNNIMRESTL
jgi:acetyltransferase